MQKMGAKVPVAFAVDGRTDAVDCLKRSGSGDARGRGAPTASVTASKRPVLGLYWALPQPQDPWQASPVGAMLPVTDS